MMKKYMFWLLIPLFFTACESNAGEEEEGVDIDTAISQPNDEMDAAPDGTDMDPVTGEPGAPADGTSPGGWSDIELTNNEFMNQPFAMGEVNRAKLKSKFQSYRIVNKEPKENRHIQGQIDTIYTVHAANSTFTFYSTGKKDMLQSADINSDEVKLKNNIAIGMTMAEFREAFPQIKRAPAPNATITVKNSIVPATMKLTFENGMLSQISYNGYVD